jgi:type VI secretion system protein ImpH
MLERAPETFEYFQAIRLLHLANRDKFKSMFQFIRQGLRVRTDVSLGFPGSDLVAIHEYPQKKSAAIEEENPNFSSSKLGPDNSCSPRYRLTVTFMGLYGASSPLPPFVAQEVLRDYQEDNFASRDFLDLITYPFFLNHALAYLKSRINYRLLWDEDPLFRGLFANLLGKIPRQGEPEEVPTENFLSLRLFVSNIRHANGLINTIATETKLRGIGLTENVPRWVTIPLCQRTKLGAQACVLGESTILGEKTRDLMGKIRFTIPVKESQVLVSLMPGGKLRAKIKEITKNYLETPLVYDLKLILAKGVAQKVKLGNSEGALGISAFLSPHPEDDKITVFSSVI